MTVTSCLTDRAFPETALNILNRVLNRADNPADMGIYLAEEIHELTGASCVLLIQCLCTPAVAVHRVVGVYPPQRHRWAESQTTKLLYETVHHTPEARQWSGTESPEIDALLKKEGFGPSMVFPLNAGTFRVGAMLVLGLPANGAVDAMFGLISSLSTIMALVLRNAILYENQEQLIRERTAELEDKNERLAQELVERKRVEEAVRRLNDELEQRVTERTAELEAKNADLEKLLKSFVGRELKMVELKERIKTLQEQELQT